jgi:NADPH:quinone reductase-like Zn-dependent oxidoreductase
MSDTATRATIVSTGEHLHAVRKLGPDYTRSEYLEALDLARAVNAGEQYADLVLGAEPDDVPDEIGGEEYAKAMADLKERGILDPSYAELTAALVRVSP